jgi:hypothetical protein
MKAFINRGYCCSYFHKKINKQKLVCSLSSILIGFNCGLSYPKGVIIINIFLLLDVVAPQILIVLFLIYLFDNIIQLISLRSLWYYGGW